MGLTSSKSSSSSSRQQYNSSSYRAPATGSAGFSRIGDNFNSLNDVQSALRREGLESSQLIVAIDYTKSNEWTGKYSCGGKCLHFLSNTEVNPYQQTIGIIARTLGAFDDDNLIPCYGFGDSSTGDRRVFSFKDRDQPCNGLEEVESVYRALTPSVKLSGPTSFAPAIYQAMKIVAESGNQYHILLLVADGQVTRASDMSRGQLSPQEQATVDAIVAASAYPLSIVMIGVGDGPWEMMKEFDDQLPQRRFDNFQFVNASQIFQRFSPQDWQRMEATFARDALMEIPEQYKAIQKMGLMGRHQPLQFQVPPPCPPPRPRITPPAQPPAGMYTPTSYVPQQAAAAALAAGAARVSGTGSAGGPSWASANGSFADRNSAGWSGAVTPERTSGHSERVSRPCDGDHTSSEALFICPITQELMEDPVLAADGYTYERAAVERWLTTHNTSPMTNARLPHKNLIANHALRSSIMEHRQNHPL